VNPRPKVLDILLRSNDLAADHALVAGVLHVEPSLQTEIINVLLARSHDVGMKALPALFDKLEPAAQAAIVTNTTRLSSALRTTIRSSHLQTRVNTVQIIRRSGNLRLAYLAALAVHDASPQVRADGGAALQELADAHCRNYAETTAALRDVSEREGELSRPIVQTLRMLRDERRYLVAALADALSNYDNHHRAEILQASMYLADELEGQLFTQGTVTRGKLTHAMLEVFTGTPSPRLAPFVSVALCHAELRRRIIAALATCRESDFFAEFIRYHWLARDPTIRRNLLSVRQVAWLDDGIEAVFALPPDAAALAPGWLLPLGIPADQKVSLLLNLALIDNSAANRAAVWALTKIDTPGATLALQGALDHEDESIRLIAQREIEHRSRQDERNVRRLRRDRPADWAYLLDASDVAEEFDDLWRHFERLHPVQAHKSGHYASQFIPGFVTQVQLKIHSPHVADRLRVLRMLTLLRAAGPFKSDVFNLANDAVPEVRAATMTALSQINDQTSRRILERAINDDEPAVQTAAIESLDLVGDKRRPELLLPKAKSEIAAVRGAAVRILLKMRVSEAVGELLSMLHDPRADHRCAAIWVADQLRLSVITPRIREIGEKDADPRIARIARHVAKRLERLHHPSTDTAAAGPPGGSA